MNSLTPRQSAQLASAMKEIGQVRGSALGIKEIYERDVCELDSELYDALIASLDRAADCILTVLSEEPKPNRSGSD